MLTDFSENFYASYSIVWYPDAVIFLFPTDSNKMAGVRNCEIGVGTRAT